MLLDQVIERLKQADPGIDVKGAADLAGAQSDRVRDATFVFRSDEQASPNALINGARQLVTVGIGVVFALSNRRDSRGQAAANKIDRVRELTREALLGWEPDDADAMITYRRGRLLDFQDGVIWWQDDYETAQVISGGV